MDPIIFFQIDEKFINRKRDLENEFFKHFNRDQLMTINLKITANNNLLVFIDNEDDKRLVLNNQTLFPELRKVDIGDDQTKKFILVVRGASSDDLSEYSELFEENGTINVLSIKDKNGRLSKICKI